MNPSGNLFLYLFLYRLFFFDLYSQSLNFEIDIFNQNQSFSHQIEFIRVSIDTYIGQNAQETISTK